MLQTYIANSKIIKYNAKEIAIPLQYITYVSPMVTRIFLDSLIDSKVISILKKGSIDVSNNLASTYFHKNSRKGITFKNLELPSEFSNNYFSQVWLSQSHIYNAVSYDFIQTIHGLKLTGIFAFLILIHYISLKL